MFVWLVLFGVYFGAGQGISHFLKNSSGLFLIYYRLWFLCLLGAFCVCNFVSLCLYVFLGLFLWFFFLLICFLFFSIVFICSINSCFLIREEESNKKVWIWVSGKVRRIWEELGEGNYNYNILYEKNYFDEKVSNPIQWYFTWDINFIQCIWQNGHVRAMSSFLALELPFYDGIYWLTPSTSDECIFAHIKSWGSWHSKLRVAA